MRDAIVDTRGSDFRRAISVDLIVAVTLALILTISWTVNGWDRLGHMLLPDPDDAMRLAQVRDWIAGQGINDWTQYRMAPPLGSPMHWSRINDFGIAGLILLATPFVGQASAEMFAVLVYPAILFAIALFLSARIARAIWGESAGLVAAVLMAVAYPGVTVFTPGRIDHHALQVVLIQLLVLALMRRPSFRTGLAVGTIAALSLIVGLESAPQVAVLLIILALFWIVNGSTEVSRMAGFAVGLGSVTLFFLMFLRPTYWTAALCDAFTPASSTAALAVAAAFAGLAAISSRLPNWYARTIVGAGFGAVALATTLYLYPSCIFGPYGAMDPFLLKFFMPHIDEANSVFAQPDLSRIIGVGGLLTTGCVASIWMVSRDLTQWKTTVPLAAAVLGSGLVMLVQARGTYLGAPLSAPVLAGLVIAARTAARFRTTAILAAWLLGAGIAYYMIPLHLLSQDTESETRGVKRDHQALCSVGGAWGQVDREPAGVIMAGTRVAAFIISGTQHKTIGAGYHRNDVGNMAMYRFFLSKPATSLKIARAWNVDYVLFCPGDFDELSVETSAPDSLATQLEHNMPPVWLTPIPLHNTPMRFYRIDKAPLPAPAAPH